MPTPKPTATDLRACGYQAAPGAWPEDEPTDDFAEFARALQLDDEYAAEVCWDYIRSRNAALLWPRNKRRALQGHPKERAAEHLMLVFPDRFRAVTGIAAPNIRSHVESVAKEHAVARYKDRQGLIRRTIDAYFSDAIAKGLDQWIADAALTNRPPEVVRKLLRLTQSEDLDALLELSDKISEEGATC